MKRINSGDIITPELMEGAILNEEFEGFKEDYSVLHCLLRKFDIEHRAEREAVISKSGGPELAIFEVGTNCGTGTNIICNALPHYKVYSLDLPTYLAHISLQHPISEGKGDKVGSNCTFPYTQLRGDSMTFDYSKYYCQIYFIDGEHDRKHPEHEIAQAMKNGALLIILHDADMEQVWAAIEANKNKYYDLYRVEDTRIAYFRKKELSGKHIENDMARNLFMNAINEAVGHPDSKMFQKINPDEERDSKRAAVLKSIFNYFGYKPAKQ